MFLCLKDLEKAWIHFRRSVELDSSNTFFRDKLDKLEERMENEDMNDKLKDLKNRFTESSGVQFLPNIDLLSTNLMKSAVFGSVRRRRISLEKEICGSHTKGHSVFVFQIVWDVIERRRSS